MSRAQLLAVLASMFPMMLGPQPAVRGHGRARTGRRGGVNHRAVRAGVLFRRWQMTGVMPGHRGLPGRAMPSWPAWTPREARRHRVRAVAAAIQRGQEAEARRWARRGGRY